MQGQLILDPNSCRLTLSGSLSESGGGEGCRARSGARPCDSGVTGRPRSWLEGEARGSPWAMWHNVRPTLPAVPLGVGI